MEDLKYIIKCDGIIVARFLHKPDRDYAIDTLRNEFEDVEWSTE